MCRQCFSALLWSVCLISLRPSLEAAAAQPPATQATKGDKDKEKPKSAPEDLKFVSSVFFDNHNDTTKFGTDVFFPTTKRFVKKVESSNPAEPARLETPALSQFVLKGISGTGNRRLAVINNRTVGQGEILEIKHNGQSYKVKCEQIKARSVILSIEGFPEKKELQLRDGL
ncbi:MAG: hypothetical protein JNN07_16160 [Verrucomicrobiales bacterium]|nr:hypothetical protein [Verrucomicrobiales bacterium]